MWNKNCWYSQRAAPRFWSILMSMQTNDFHSSVCHSTHLSLFHWWHHSVNNRAFVHLHTHIAPSGRWYNTHTHPALSVCQNTQLRVRQLQLLLHPTRLRTDWDVRIQFLQTSDSLRLTLRFWALSDRRLDEGQRQERKETSNLIT